MSVEVQKAILFLVSMILLALLVVLGWMVMSWWYEYGLRRWQIKREQMEKNERRKVIHLWDRDLVDRKELLEFIEAAEQDQRAIGDEDKADCFHQVKRLVEFFPRVCNIEDPGQPPHENG